MGKVRLEQGALAKGEQSVRVVCCCGNLLACMPWHEPDEGYSVTTVGECCYQLHGLPTFWRPRNLKWLAYDPESVPEPGVNECRQPIEPLPDSQASDLGITLERRVAEALAAELVPALS